MAPMLLDLGGAEVAIVIAIALLLFGGRLAGLGKSAGRAIKEFKEETGMSSAGAAPKVDSRRRADEAPADPAPAEPAPAAAADPAPAPAAPDAAEHHSGATAGS